MRRPKLELRPGRSRTSLRVVTASLVALVVLSVLFHPHLLGRPEAPRHQRTSAEGAPLPSSDTEVELIQFTTYVSDHVQATFGAAFAERGRPYPQAKLVHFDGRVRAPCGMPDVVTGTFYCPEEQRVYVDLEGYRAIRRRRGASGDFAEAYLLAHVLGHHVQNVQGTTAWVRRKVARNPSLEAALAERTELQADCYAAVWARVATERELLRPGDLEGGLDAMTQARAESSAGADAEARSLEPLVHVARGRRAEWFTRGFENGRLEACDTFARDAL